MDSTKGINGCDYTCDVCDFIILGTCLTYHCQFFGQTNRWSSIVYLVTQQVQRHNSKCLQGSCVKWGPPHHMSTLC
jgi:hypothetical protein